MLASHGTGMAVSGARALTGHSGSLTLKTSKSRRLQAIFLGTADGHTSARRDHSGILLRADGLFFLLDGGAAAARFLLGEKYPPNVPDGIWLSHMHSDHNGQVASLIQSLWLRGRKNTLHFFGPREVMRAMKDWLERCLLFPGLIGFPIEWHAVKPGKPAPYGPFTLTAFPTEHLTGLAQYFKRSYPKTCFECFGVTLTFARRRYVYSADLAHPRELAPALQGGATTALLCELTHFPERELFREVAKYPVKSVWITHYPDPLVGRGKKLKTLAREEKFLGAVHLMHDKVAQEI
jgi:ribonuclease BN (tRNA processing enzyme)